VADAFFDWFLAIIILVRLSFRDFRLVFILGIFFLKFHIC